MQSPLFLGGVGLLSGGGASGMNQGIQSGILGLKNAREEEQYQRQRDQQAQRDQVWNGMFASGQAQKSFGGLPPGMLPVLQAAGPDQGVQLAAKGLMSKSDAEQQARLQAQHAAIQFEYQKKLLEMQQAQGLAQKQKEMELINGMVQKGAPQPAQAPQAQPPAGMQVAPQSGQPVPQMAPPNPYAPYLQNMPAIHMINPNFAKGIMETPGYKSAQTAAEQQGRLEQVQKMGIDPLSPEGRGYVLTGHLPKQEPDRVAINKNDDQRVEVGNAIDNAENAKKLNKQAYVGWAPETRAMIGGWFGLDSAAKTQEYQKAATLLSQQIAKANSGGRVNAFEQRLMEHLMGGLNMSEGARAQILDDAIKHLKRRQELLDRRDTEFRNGRYYNPQGGQQAAPSKTLVYDPKTGALTPGGE